MRQLIEILALLSRDICVINEVFLLLLIDDGALNSISMQPKASCDKCLIVITFTTICQHHGTWLMSLSLAKKTRAGGNHASVFSLADGELKLFNFLHKMKKNWIQSWDEEWIYVAAAISRFLLAFQGHSVCIIENSAAVSRTSSRVEAKNFFCVARKEFTEAFWPKRAQKGKNQWIPIIPPFSVLYRCLA